MATNDPIAAEKAAMKAHRTKLWWIFACILRDVPRSP